MKKVLITGGATGIGKACAEAFKNKGYEVFITFNKTAPDYEVNALKCDLRSVEEIRALFDNVPGIIPPFVCIICTYTWRSHIYSNSITR